MDVLGPLDIEVVHPDDFLLDQLDLAPNEDPSAAAEGKWYQNNAVNLLGRLDAYRDDVLRFTSPSTSPSTTTRANATSAWSIQQKISGSWRTKTGADHFCAIRSYVSTMKKHGHRVLDGLGELFEGRVWLPGAEHLRKMEMGG